MGIINEVLDWFGRLQPAMAAAIVSLAVALVTTVATVFVAPSVKYAFDRRLENRKLDLAYRFEQRKALKDHIGRHKGPFLEAADALSHRLWNYETNEQQRWLKLDGIYFGDLRYYPKTFAYRLLLALGTGRVLEREALFIDATVAGQEDVNFLKAVKLNQQIWTHAGLFDGLSYDVANARDHFFKDTLVAMAESLFPKDKPSTLTAFSTAIQVHNHPYIDVLTFVDDIHSGDGRFRHHRLLCAHLVLMATLNSFGYDFQRSSPEAMHSTLSRLTDADVRRNLCVMIRRMKLQTDKEFAALLNLLEGRGAWGGAWLSRGLP